MTAKYTDLIYANALHTQIDATLSATGQRTTLASNDPDTLADYLAALAGTYGAISAYGSNPTTTAQLIAYAQTKASSLHGTLRTYASVSNAKVAATDDMLSRLTALATWGAANPTTPYLWVAADGTVQSILGSALATLRDAVLTYFRTVESQLADVISQVGSSAITTTGQIDSYGWTV